MVRNIFDSHLWHVGRFHSRLFFRDFLGEIKVCAAQKENHGMPLGYTGIPTILGTKCSHTNQNARKKRSSARERFIVSPACSRGNYSKKDTGKGPFTLCD